MTFVGPMGLTVSDADLEASLLPAIAEVEQLLHDATRHDEELIAHASKHLILAGGKRFRPLLTLVCAHFGDPQAPGVVLAATVMELTHLATLYHDDVMDQALLRRGAASANAEWGNKVAVLTGDLLFAKATQLIAGLGAEAITIQAETAAELVTGQIRETLGPAKQEDPIAHYRAVVRAKTGSLIGTSCRLGALLSGAPSEVVTALAAYGAHLGIAFQLGDDVLDVVGDAAVSGKAPGTDLRQGIPTLPVLYARASASGGAADQRLNALLDQDMHCDDAAVAETLALLRVHPGLAQAQCDLAAAVAAARGALAGVPSGSARDALDALCDVAAHRVR